MIAQKMPSWAELEFEEDANLFDLTNIEVVLRQGIVAPWTFYKCITDAQPVTATKLLFTLSATETAQLDDRQPLKIQVLYTDANGRAQHTDVVYASVAEIIKEGIYGLQNETGD